MNNPEKHSCMAGNIQGPKHRTNIIKSIDDNLNFNANKDYYYYINRDGKADCLSKLNCPKNVNYVGTAQSKIRKLPNDIF